MPSVHRSALVATAPKTNGVISLGWDNGQDPQTVIINKTTGQAINAGTNGNITLGQLATMPQTFVATNQFGESNELVVTPAPDTNRLTLYVYSYRADWKGNAGILQISSNLSVWQDRQPISANGSVLITNDQRAGFYRVKL
jgi:hypothetical protein